MGWPEWRISEIITARPQARVNQLGYLLGRPKQATLISDAREPVGFAVRDRDGGIAHTGLSQVWRVRPEPTSGLNVHVVDFSALNLPGAGFRIEAGAQISHPFEIRSRLYERLTADALRFFYVMRSGTPISDSVAPGYGRPAGHLGRPPNRGDLAVPAWTGPEAQQLYPEWRCEGTFDVSGGWYDAGDYGKYVTSGAIAVWQLLSTLDLLRRADETTGSELADMIRTECRWQLDWLLRMRVPDSDPLAGLAFHRVHGTRWSPMPGWAHEDPTERVLHRPSTAASLHVAAATAQGARLFRPTDPAYAQTLLDAARSAYQAALRHPRLIAPDDHAKFGGGPYSDDRLEDDFYWAAAELWLATSEEIYRQQLADSPQHAAEAFDPGGYDFDRVTAPARLDLALVGDDVGDNTQAIESVRRGADRMVELQRQQPWGQPYAPTEGWDWGSNGRILNNLVVMAAAHLLSGVPSYADAVATGMDYLLGRNGLGQSYITGYGTDYSCHQRTRQFGHDLDPALPPPLQGVLAGGANSRPSPDFPYDSRLLGLPPQCCYLDEPTSEVTNDVCIRWNAPLVWVATYLSAVSG
ncbi:MAG TPA: glycoside hydrolase family 9 protein [Propionibacteriaceae bacterium]|nr:glycoside hydrolase family 9 protein [Propionibacteriaceae bacterium]